MTPTKEDPAIEALRKRLAAATKKDGARGGFRDGVVEEGLASVGIRHPGRIRSEVVE
jgi:hypothetical protein